MMQRKPTETTVTIMGKAASRGSIVATDVKASSIRQRNDVTEETTYAQQTAKGKAKDATEVVPVDVGPTQARAEESWVLVTNKKVRKNTGSSNNRGNGKRPYLSMLRPENRSEEIVTKYDTYSSFFIGTDYKHVKNLLAPDIWLQGALIKRYYESKQ